jgi:uncharacterized protein (TIGR02646 family)
MRERLGNEQHGLCAYCMARIETSGKIEHIVPQSQSTDKESLEWKNMVLVCHGGTGKPHALQTCDAHKEGRMLEVLSPLNKNSISLIKYSHSGRILSDNDQCMNDLESVLNLNVEWLVHTRKSVLDKVKSEIGRRLSPGKSGSKTFFKERLEKVQTPDSDGYLESYVGIVIWYLEKKMRRA